MDIATNSPTELLTVNGDLSAAGTVAPSDRRLKKDIETFKDGLAVVRRMNPVKFRYTKESGIPSRYSHLGLIAQDLLSYAPYLVHQDDSEDPEDHYLAIADSEIKYLLVNAIKDQQSQIEALQNKVKTLKVERDELSNSLASIEERLQKIEFQKRLEIDA